MMHKFFIKILYYLNYKNYVIINNTIKINYKKIFVKYGEY